MVIKKYYTYRHAIGGALKSGSKSIEEGLLIAKCFATIAGQVLSNHECFVVEYYGQERAFCWTDNVLYECSKLIAGDCNKEYPIGTILWESPRDRQG